MAKTNYLVLGHIFGTSPQDIEADDLSPRVLPGTVSYMVDKYGPRIFMYGRNTKGSAMVQGECTIRLADVAVVNITSGTVSSATKAAAFTALKHDGEILYVLDNDDAAGAAPEGESSIIGPNNTAATVNVDSNYPFTAALAVNDDVTVISPGWHLDTSGAAAKAQECKGIVVAKGGITSLNYGWVHQYGICPIVNIKAATGLTDRACIITGVSKVDADAAGGWELVIGYNLGTVTSDIVADQGMCFINVFNPTLNSGTP